MITCNRCLESLNEDKFYKSSLKKQDFTCAKCSVIKGKENRLKRFSKNPIHSMYLYAKNSAKTTNKTFLLTEEEYCKLVSKPCYYCEEPLSGNGINLDRINNDKSIGYRLDNVLPCCVKCNLLRGDRLTVEETKVAVDAIQKFRKSHI